MTSIRTRGLAAGAAIAVGLTGAAGLAAATRAAFTSSAPARTVGVDPQIEASFGALPLAFEPNQGQAAPKVDFVAHARGTGLQLTGRTAVLTPASGTPVSMTLEGADPRSEARASQPLEGVVNYLTGDDPERWRTGIPTFGRVGYSQVWPGIDVTYYGTQGGELEYDFIVAPETDPGTISLRFDGQDSVRVASDGSLVLGTRAGDVIQAPPVIYQDIAGDRLVVDGAYRVGQDGRVGFDIGAYDPSRVLVIDPQIEYSSYLGGGDFDRSYGMTVDDQGSAYITGVTGSQNAFPTSDAPVQDGFGGGNNDAYITKMTPDGSGIVYSSFLGGVGDESGYAVAVSQSGLAAVTGRTTSVNFPTFAPQQLHYAGGSEDVFVSVLMPNGDGFVYSTYLGGNKSDLGRALAWHGSDLLVTGFTSSLTFPTTPGAYDTLYADNRDVFVTRLNEFGQFIFSSFLGGPTEDQGRGIDTDAAGNIIVTGWTRTNGFPTTPDAFQPTRAGGQTDGFITKIAADGLGPEALLYSTYYGGSNIDVLRNVVVDSTGAIYSAGRTNSLNFPTSEGAYQRIFSGGVGRDVVVVKLKPELGRDPIVYSTYFGGTKEDEARGIGLDVRNGQVSVIGVTKSNRDMAPEVPAGNQYGGGPRDAFAFKLNATGTNLVWALYVGGGGNDEAWAMGMDPQGATYLSGLTDSLNYPYVTGSFQNNQGGVDAFITKIVDEAPGLLPPGPLNRQ